MKKFKPNKTTKAIFAALEIFAPFSVGAPIMMLLIGNDNYTTNEILRMCPLFIITLILSIVFFCMLNLVTLPFTKYTVFLFDDHFSRGNTEVRYDDVTRIEIDSGVARSVEPCCLDCYSGNELLISIEDPSLLMSFLVWQRCKNAKLKYTRVKRLVLLWVGVLLMNIALGLYGAQ